MIGPATLGDLWTLRRKPRNQVMLYNQIMLARPYRRVWFLIRCLLEGNGSDGLTLMYREPGVRAAIQSIGRSKRPEQDIVLMAIYSARCRHITDHDIWFRLLEQLCIQAGHHHIQRLYAALSQGHEELREVFRQLGFDNYTQQSILRLEGPDWDQGTTFAPMRSQSRRDVWAIHKLYGAITPRLVQHVEARESRTWVLPRGQGRQLRQRGWIMGPDDDLMAYLQLTSGVIGHIFTLLLRPEHRDITTDILRFGLGQIPDSQPVYLLLRDYQREILLPAGDLGFQPIGEQMLLCKRTTVAERGSVILKPALEPSLESHAPVPTILPHRSDAQSYDRTTRHHQQHRSTTGGSSSTHSAES